jgi:hypothetical protein
MPQTAYEFLATHQTQLVQLLDRNHDVSAFIVSFLAHLSDYAHQKGVPFEAIRIDYPRIEDVGGDQTFICRISHLER